MSLPPGFSIEDSPLQPPPPGQISNFVNPESRGLSIITVCYVFVLFMWSILLLRLYSKTWIIRKFGWEDGQ